MARILAFVLGAVALLVLVGLAALYVFRVEVAQVAMERLVAGQGIPNARFQVAALDMQGAEVRDISAGDADELTATALVLRYDLAGVFERPLADLIEAVSLEGLRLRLDLTGDGAPLGSLQPLLDGPDSAPSESEPVPFAALPAITIQNAAIDIAHVDGESSVRLDAQAHAREDGRLYVHAAPHLDGALGQATGTAHALADGTGRVDGSLVIDDGTLAVPARFAGTDVAVSGLSGAVAYALDGWALESMTAAVRFDTAIALAENIKNGSLSIDITEEEVSGDGTLQSNDGRVTADVNAMVADPMGSPAVNITLAAQAAADAALLTRIDLPFQPAKGDAALQLKLWGTTGSFTDWVNAMQRGSGSGIKLPDATALGARFALSLRGLDDRGTYAGLDADVSGTASVVDGELRLALDDGSRVAAARIEEAWLVEAGIPSELSGLFAAGLALDLAASAETPLRLRVQRDESDYGVDVAGALRVSSLGEPDRDVTAQVVGRLGLSPDGALRTFAARSPNIEARGVSIAGVPIERVALAGGMSGTPDAFKGTANTALDMDGLDAGNLHSEDMSLRLPLAFSRDGSTFETVIAGPGRLDAASLRVAAYSLAGGVGLAIPSGWLRMEEAAGLSHELVLQPDPLVVAIPQDDGPPLRAEITAEALRITGQVPNDAPYRGRAALTGGSVRVPNLVAVDGLSATTDFDLDLSRPAADVEAQRVESLRDDVPAPPLHVAGKLRRSGNAIAFDADVTPRVFVAGAPRFALSGRYDIAKASGTIELAPTAIVFAPGELQPADLAADLAALRNVAGEAEVGATLTLDTDGVRGTSTMTLSDLSFAMDELAVDDLDLSLTLASLVPLTSPPGQTISIGQIESVLPIGDLRATYQVLPGTTPKARVEQLTFALGGGTFTLRDVLVDPAGEGHAFEIEIQGLQLGEALAAADIDGLTGDGPLSGVIPVAVNGETFAIADGRLAADGPGVLRFRSADLASSLPPDADALDLLQSPVDLALLAFQDFHYETLEIAIDKAADGEAVMKLTLAGKNPAVLEGYPFVFNINLAGNLNPIMAAVEQGLRLSDAVFGRAWTLQ